MFFSFSAFFPPPGQPSSTRYDDRPPYNYESQHTSYPTSYPDTSSSSWDRYSSHSPKAINLYFWLFLNIGFNFRFVEIYVMYFNMINSRFCSYSLFRVYWVFSFLLPMIWISASALNEMLFWWQDGDVLERVCRSRQESSPLWVGVQQVSLKHPHNTKSLAKQLHISY